MTRVPTRISALRAKLRSGPQSLDQRLFRSPPNIAPSWRGTAEDGDADLRVLRFGGCDFRAMPLAHTVASEAGFPRHLAELLADRGQRMEFSNIFTAELEALPKTPEAVRQHVKLTGPPDVVLVQIAANYSYRTILGFGRRRNIVRDRVGLALGRHVFLGYKVATPFFRRLGRHHLDTAGARVLARDFLKLVRAEWPDARLIVLGLFPVFTDGAWNPAVQNLLSDEIREEAEALGLEYMSMEGVVPQTQAAYCANGSMLSDEGSRAVAEALLSRLDHGAPAAAERAGSAATRR
jgi:hypothetical protein